MINLKEYDRRKCAMCAKNHFDYHYTYINNINRLLEDLDDVREKGNVNNYYGFKNVYTFTLQVDKVKEYPFCNPETHQIIYRDILTYFEKELGTKDIIFGVLAGSSGNEWIGNECDYTTATDEQLDKVFYYYGRKRIRMIFLCDRIPLLEAFKDTITGQRIEEIMNAQKSFDMYRTFYRPAIQNVITDINKKHTRSYYGDDSYCNALKLYDDVSSNIHLYLNLDDLNATIQDELKKEFYEIVKKKLGLDKLDKLGLSFKEHPSKNLPKWNLYLKLPNTNNNEGE